MFSYAAYGLGIHSTLPMPELMPCRAAADVVVRHGTITAPETQEAPYRIRCDEGAVVCFMRDVGGVLVRDGREIIIDPLPGAEARGYRFLVMGFALGMLLHQRGLLALHASAVAVDGEVAAFIGWKGMGKSTMAAALHGRGHPLVTDDLLALTLDAGDAGIRVRPGFPQLKLWPDAAAVSLGDDPDALPRVHPDGVKRARSAGHGFPQDPLPLRCIYLLDYQREAGGPLLHVEPLSPQASFLELVKHTYALLLMGNQGVNPVHLQQCTYLAQRVPIRRLWRRRMLNRLPDLARQVEEDLAHRVPAPVHAPLPAQASHRISPFPGSYA